MVSKFILLFTILLIARLSFAVDCSYYLTPPHGSLNAERAGDGYVGIDTLKDPEFDGSIYRSFVSERNDDQLILFATQSPIAARLGIYYEPTLRMITYPDRKSLTNRLKVLYQEWGIKDGIFPEDVTGHITSQQFMEMVRDRNRFPISNPRDPEYHMHDVLSHMIGWIAFTEVTQVVRSRLLFLDKVETIAAAAKKDKAFKSAKLKQQIQDLVDTVKADLHQEDYHSLEGGTTSSDFIRSDGANRITSVVASAGSTSAADLKKAYLKMALPAAVKKQIDSISVGSFKIPKTQSEKYGQRIYDRFFGH